MTEPRSLCEAFARTVAAHPDAVALRLPGGGTALTWATYAERVRTLASRLAGLGVARGTTVATMLTNRPEFHVADTAAMHLGATTYSIYNTSSPEQIAFLLRDADTRVVICEDRFAATIRAAGGPVEHLLVVEDGDLDRLPETPGFDFDAAWQAVGAEDILCLIYTSGTTGDPKGVEFSHSTMLALDAAVTAVFDIRPDDRAISYLPSSHIADRGLNHYFAMVHGPQVTCVGDVASLVPAMLDVRPTVFAAVPRVWEKLQLGVGQQLQAAPELAAAFEAGHPPVLSAVRAKLGLDELRWALSGAAPIAPSVYGFLTRLGLPISEVWGMSECGLGTGAAPDAAKPGTVGPLLPGLEGRIAPDGELLVRGPTLMSGYRNAPTRTAEAIDADGWLHTGDLATMDDDGHVSIVGRLKELIINSGGKNMSPTTIENTISSASPLLGPVLVVGDAKPYNVALLTLEPDAATAFAAQHGLGPDPAVLVKDDRVQDTVRAAVEAGNARLSRIEQIKRYTILPTFWEPGGEELTPTMKLRRGPTAHKYAAEIDSLYTAAD